MNISYNWLKRYIALTDDAETVAKILTSIGLEVGTVEKVQTVKGGLEGLVIGEVLTCVPHPNSDHLHITEVNIGAAEAQGSVTHRDGIRCILSAVRRMWLPDRKWWWLPSARCCMMVMSILLSSAVRYAARNLSVCFVQKTRLA